MTRPKAIVFSGAGLSAESGIPTYRASDGLWENHRIEDVATSAAWQSHPVRVWDFLDARRVQMAKAEPNPAHYALAKLEAKYDVIHLTQNIDNLLEEAGCSYVHHLHGKIDRFRCFGCEIRFSDPRTHCNKCGGLVRHDVVLFGEPVPLSAYVDGKELAKEAEVFIGVGTSAVVEPAASIVTYCRKVPLRYWVDLQAPTHKHAQKCLYLPGPASNVLVDLVEVLLHYSPTQRARQNKHWARAALDWMQGWM